MLYNCFQRNKHAQIVFVAGKVGDCHASSIFSKAKWTVPEQTERCDVSLASELMKKFRLLSNQLSFLVWESTGAHTGMWLLAIAPAH